MESSNENIEVKIKISDKLKHLLIGLLTGAISVLIYYRNPYPAQNRPLPYYV